jgi:hypothetical protein
MASRAAIGEDLKDLEVVERGEMDGRAGVVWTAERETGGIAIHSGAFSAENWRATRFARCK